MKTFCDFRGRVLAIALLGLTAGGAVHAHHSFSAFDMAAQKTIAGEIVEFQWTNPHTWTWINVTNEDGSVTKWGLEGMSPNFLGRRGWTKDTLTPGAHVQIVIAPLKSGEPGGTFMRATLEDGKEMVMFGSAPPPPGTPPPAP